MDGPGAEVVESFVSPELAAPADAPVALVVDEGFDLGLEALAGRVLAAYHVECAPEPPTSPPLEATPFAEAKASFHARIALAVWWIVPAMLALSVSPE